MAETLTPEERALPEGWRLSDERLAEIDAALNEEDLDVPLDPSGVLSDTAVLLMFCSELRAEVRRLRGTGAAQPALTPEERYQLETIRLMHAADEDHMENSDGREWTFTAIGIHGQRGDLLHIIDRLNAAATRGQDPIAKEEHT